MLVYVAFSTVVFAIVAVYDISMVQYPIADIVNPWLRQFAIPIGVVGTVAGLINLIHSMKCWDRVNTNTMWHKH